MTREQRAIQRSWLTAIGRTVELGDADAAYRLTVGYVRRLREVGAL